MGLYLNPGNGKFRETIQSAIYVDKTGLIAYTNSVIKTRNKYLCVSRPRRFGKSMALEMLAAYYDLDVDSTALFANLEIARDPSFARHRNKYDVIFLNMQDFLSRAADMRDLLKRLQTSLSRELVEKYGEYLNGLESLDEIMGTISQATGIYFVVLIDEWDCVFRVHKNDVEAQKDYLDFLRLLLKDKEYIALAYMTGILPVKKYGTHSALNMFDEYSMTDPGQLARFVGFTQEEVDSLCERYSMNVEAIKSWYNGYKFIDMPAVYSPNSVVRAMLFHRCANYWTRTETYDALKIYIDLDMEGLRDAIVELLAGGRKYVDPEGFANDMVTFTGYEDVLTLLIHLGYLGYDADQEEVFVPNKEIAKEFVKAMRRGPYSKVVETVRASEKLLEAVWALDGTEVAQGIDIAHMNTSHLTYNDENALAYTLSLALYAAREYYTTIREMPTGNGFADLIMLPRPFHPEKPALVVELKWDKTADTAIEQIRRKQYPAALADYRGSLLLVGVAYDKETRRHECRIERI